MKRWLCSGTTEIIQIKQQTMRLCFHWSAKTERFYRFIKSFAGLAEKPPTFRGKNGTCTNCHKPSWPDNKKTEKSATIQEHLTELEKTVFKKLQNDS